MWIVAKIQSKVVLTVMCFFDETHDRSEVLIPFGRKLRSSGILATGHLDRHLQTTSVHVIVVLHATCHTSIAINDRLLSWTFLLTEKSGPGTTGTKMGRTFPGNLSSVSIQLLISDSNWCANR